MLPKPNTKAFIYLFPELLDAFPRSIILSELPNDIRFNALYTFHPKHTYKKHLYRYDPGAGEETITEESCFKIVLVSTLLAETITLKFNRADMAAFFVLHDNSSGFVLSRQEVYTDEYAGRLFTCSSTKEMLNTLVSSGRLNNFADSTSRQLRILYEFNKFESTLLDFIRN